MAIKGCTWILALCLSSTAYSQTCGTGPAVAIADGSGSATPGAVATASIVFPAFYTNAITDLTFDLNITHTYVGDLIVTLTSPAGTVVTLMDRPGVPASTFGCSQNNVDATFDDASGVAVETECSAAPAISGTLNPTGSLSSFDGETPAGTWTISVTDNAGQDTGSIVPTGSCIDVTTVPVVLSAFTSEQKGRHIRTRWQTASEAFNLGFNLWGNIEGEWTQLNRKLIPSKTVDSVEPQHYRKRFNVNKLPSPPTEIGISSISSSGFEEFYGPFQVGEQYGELAVPKAIDWTEQRSKYAQAMNDAGFEYRKNRWRKVNRRIKAFDERRQRRYPDSWITIDEPGVYRITHEELLSHGVNLDKFPVKHLALTQAGRPIPRIVKGSTRRARRFGAGGEIIFYAKPPQGEDARFSNVANIRISADVTNVLNAPTIAAESDEGDAQDISETHITRIGYGKPNGYSFIIPGDTPWYDEVIYAFGQVGSKTFEFDVDDTAELNQPVSFIANLMGGTSFDNVDADGDGEVEPDHHFRLFLNRDTFPDPIYEGYAEKVDAVKIESNTTGQLQFGVNRFELEVIPDNGHNLDAAYFLNAKVGFAKQNNVNKVHHQFELTDDQEWVAFNDVSQSIKQAYAYDTAGNFSRLNLLERANSKLVKVAKSIGESTKRAIWLSSETGYLSPTSISRAPTTNSQDLNLEGIDYVVIAPPALITEDLKRYVKAQVNGGRNTKIISAFDIYAKYSDGIENPNAIKQFLNASALGKDNLNQSEFGYVLLVGGHTYNYLGHNVANDERPINLLPSFYRPGPDSINRQIPTAVPFVDFNDDGAPEKAIGRWPVRDAEQLKLVVDKTLAWHATGSNKDNLHALLIAQKDEDLNNFSASLNRLENRIGHQDQPWNNVNKVYFSDILADTSVPTDDKVNTARDRLVDGFNQGPALTVYSGHASPTNWGNQNLLTTSVVDRFTNSEQPTLIVPLACYTTYYETPNVKSLAERLFTDNPAGAVGLSGPALLSYASSNERFAKTLFRLMTQEGKDLGTSVLMAKQALLGTGERSQTVIYNWVTLADPTLSFGLPAADLIVDDDNKKGQN